MKSPSASTMALSLALNRLQASLKWAHGMLANLSTMAALRAFWVVVEGVAVGGRMAEGRPYMFQQDGAPARNAKVMQDWLKEHLPDFWGKDLWPPSSPDCNPLDYYVWGACERTINRTPYNTQKALKAAIVDEFANMSRAHSTLACSGSEPGSRPRET